MLTVPLLAVGCASSTPPEPIRIGSAPAKPTGKINLALPVDLSGFFVFDRWPNACDLLTDRDLRAVFPQARDIARKPRDEKLTILPNLLSTAPAPSPRDVTVKNASCGVAFSLPGAEREDTEREDKYPGSSTGYQLRVNVDGAGTRKVVRANHSRADLKYETRVNLGGADCTVSSGDFRCLKDRLEFGVSIMTTSGQDGLGEKGEPSLRYRLGTKVTTFQLGKDYKRQTRFQEDHIGSELVKAVASKL